MPFSAHALHLYSFTITTMALWQDQPLLHQNQPPPLQTTGFCPNHFFGDIIHHDPCHAHYLSFTDYLIAHNLDDLHNAVHLVCITTIFKTTYTEKASFGLKGKFLWEVITCHIANHIEPMLPQGMGGYTSRESPWWMLLVLLKFGKGSPRRKTPWLLHLISNMPTL